MMWRCPENPRHDSFFIEGTAIYMARIYLNQQDNIVDVDTTDHVSTERNQSEVVICNECRCRAEWVQDYSSPRNHQPLSREWRTAAEDNTVRRREAVSD